MTDAERERAAVVAMLRAGARAEREKADQYSRPRGGFSTYETYHGTRAGALKSAADAIEAGEHLRGGY